MEKTTTAAVRSRKRAAAVAKQKKCFNKFILSLSRSAATSLAPAAHFCYHARSQSKSEEGRESAVDEKKGEPFFRLRESDKKTFSTLCFLISTLDSLLLLLFCIFFFFFSKRVHVELDRPPLPSSSSTSVPVPLSVARQGRVEPERA